MVMAGAGERARLWLGSAQAGTEAASGSVSEATMAWTGGSLPGKGLARPAVHLCAAEGAASTWGPMRPLRAGQGRGGAGWSVGRRGGSGRPHTAAASAVAARSQGAGEHEGGSAARPGCPRSLDLLAVRVNLVNLGPLDQQPLVGDVHDEHGLAGGGAQRHALCGGRGAGGGRGRACASAVGCAGCDGRPGAWARAAQQDPPPLLSRQD